MIFIHDHTFLRKNNCYYTTGTLNNELFERYIKIFGKIEVCAYYKDVKDIPNSAHIVTNANFYLIRKSHHIVGMFKANKILKEKLERTNQPIIIRMPSILGNMAVDICKRYKKDYLIEAVGCPFDAFWYHGVIGKVAAIPMFLAMKKRILNAPAVLYVTNRFLQKRYPTNGDSIGCSDVTLREIKEDVLSNRIKRIINSENNIINIGTAAAVNVKYKGQQYVIKAIGKLKKEGITCFRYEIAGSGDQNYLRSVAEKYEVTDQVIFLGGISHDEIFNWLDRLDIYIQPSKQEGLPRSLIEAMSRALPCMGARTGGIPELINKKTIFNKNSGNVDGIVSILKGIEREQLIMLAKENFIKAKEFDKNYLEEKRKKFYEQYFKDKLLNNKSCI